MLYIKALHIVFVVTWFAGMFYIVRLFIYQREAQDKDEPERSILTRQLSLMAKRLWFGITWPSAVLTLIFGPLSWYVIWHMTLPDWLNVKLGFVLGLYAYFFSLHAIFKQQSKGIYKWSSQKLRVWNEVATIFLVAIVMLATVKDGMSWLWGLIGLIGFVVVLMSAIKIYKALRKSRVESRKLVCAFHRCGHPGAEGATFHSLGAAAGTNTDPPVINESPFRCLYKLCVFPNTIGESSNSVSPTAHPQIHKSLAVVASVAKP